MQEVPSSRVRRLKRLRIVWLSLALVSLLAFVFPHGYSSSTSGVHIDRSGVESLLWSRKEAYWAAGLPFSPWWTYSAKTVDGQWQSQSSIQTRSWSWLCLPPFLVFIGLWTCGKKARTKSPVDPPARVPGVVRPNRPTPEASFYVAWVFAGINAVVLQIILQASLLGLTHWTVYRGFMLLAIAALHSTVSLAFAVDVLRKRHDERFDTGLLMATVVVIVFDVAIVLGSGLSIPAVLQLPPG